MAATDHLEEQIRLNQVEGPSGLFIIQETGCNKQFNDLEVGKREDEGRDAGGRGGVKDGRKKSRLPSHHQCNHIMQPMNQNKRHANTLRHLFRLFFFKHSELVVSLQLTRKHKNNHNFSL